ncbi:MAG: HAD-IIIA family hydrolase [Candidatus Caenarcaniphilales bacterium]|nr:HAD-IIIA family hydrolase [Candidatus Caenarcaniphilales bacterium]
MKFANYLKPDFTFRKISDLHPEFCYENGIKALIFDLDDTLAVEHSGIISEDLIEKIKELLEAKIKVGIITNNFFSTYCKKVRDLLLENGLELPTIENAYKPSIESFRSFLEFWNLAPEEIGMVGDGILTDTMGAKLQGLKSIRVRWFQARFLKQDFLLFLRELLVTVSDSFRRFVLQHKSLHFNFERKEGREIVFLINTESGSYKQNEEGLQIKIEELNKATNKNFCTVSIKDEKAIKKFARQIKFGFIDTLVAVGGDGTVREAINLISQNWKVNLGIIPLGTGNLLAKRLKIPLSFEEALEVVLQNNMKTLSLGSVNEKYFAMIAGCGVDASIMKETKSEHKQLMGPLAYLVQAAIKLFQFRRHIFIIKLNGITFRKNAVTVISMIGNNLIEAFIPGAVDESVQEKDHNSLDVYIVKENPNRLDLINSSINLLRDQHKEDPNIEHFKTDELSIISRPNCDVQIDGDYFGTTPIKVKLHKNILNVLVPE